VVPGRGFSSADPGGRGLLRFKAILGPWRVSSAGLVFYTSEGLEAFLGPFKCKRRVVPGRAGSVAVAGPGLVVAPWGIARAARAAREEVLKYPRKIKSSKNSRKRVDTKS